MAIVSDWEDASFATRVAYCGSLLFWISSIWIWPEYWDSPVDKALGGCGLLLLLVFGLRERKPPVVVTSLGLHSTEQIEDLSKAQIG